MRSRKCYILSMSKNTAYEQKDMNMVISEPIRNPWSKWASTPRRTSRHTEDSPEYDLQCKIPLDAIHAMLAVKYIHDKMEKAIGNITASRVARTRLVKSESRLLTDWQTEILEIMEANGVPEENIGKVLDLL